jgi:beta-lactamase superfamily II metal-dependent hydrolase
MRWMLLFAAVLLAVPAQAARNTCGDGRARAGELCDGNDFRGATCADYGFSQGSLACDSACDIDLSGCYDLPTAICGDGIVEGAEECDGGSDLACPGVCSAHCACPEMPPGDLQVAVLDVGQGDGIVVVSPDGFVLVVDAGTESSAYAIEAFLVAEGITGVDYTLVSHFDADHVGGMDAVLGYHPEVAACFDHGGARSTLEYDEYDVAAGDRRFAVAPGDLLDLGPSLQVEVLHASQDASSENLNSVVVRLQYDDVAMLLGGDCEGPCESLFDPGPTQLYKVHHHGADDSSSTLLLDRMDPWTALISAGEGNSFGHPAAGTLDRLADAQASVYRTDLSGDLVVWSDGLSYTVNGEPVCSAGDVRTCGEYTVGACQLGQRDCFAGMWGECVGAIDPVTEVCDNGVDDDCDGAVDGADGDCAPATTGVVIGQVGYDTVGTDSVEEFVDLYNAGSADAALDGWSLVDNLGSWTLPTGLSIPAGGWLSIARDQAGYSALYGEVPDIDGLTLSLGNSGDVLSLRDAGGAEVDRVAWEGFEAGWSIGASTGDSIERVDPNVDSDSSADWAVTSPADPYGLPGPVGPTCGDGVCDPGEDCGSCSDCAGRTGGKPANRYCCGDGTAQGPEGDGSVCDGNY